ncbi:hypothetical protein MIND_01000000 [Mycena indigotica]|uniref:Uncharacterized protein n=1 Tax=Mycena indigotica TaxID=2126181 RepID=A0A8H6S859_9AGAR|nr:uncharacterized protein MIND_01000000 [Mycena indigotica]KAF7294634.1 hypothetical protein MIND_01000000 [Mycena indigotica]
MQAPPVYTAERTSADAPSGVSEAPPAYSAPDTFNVGGKQTKRPFVNVSQLKGHLALMHEFAELKLKVEGLSAQEATVQRLPTDKDRRWAYFVGLAVERFEKWCKTLEPAEYEKGLATLLPPVDVIMVWHSYLLNPSWFDEDVLRHDALKGLANASIAFGASLDGQLSEILSTEPLQQRLDHWLKATLTPYDPLEASSQMVTKEVACPRCRAVVYAPYMTEEGTGYLQEGFSIACSRDNCTCEITRDTLALRKFANDLAKPDTGKAPSMMAGTVHTATNVKDLSRGHIVKATMLQAYSMRRPTKTGTKEPMSDEQYALFLMEKANWQLSRLKSLCAMQMKGQGGRLIGRISSAYSDDKIFSVELVGSVLRQGSFVGKMYDLQWTQPGFFDSAEDEIALQHTIARYHAFIDLMSSSPASFFVPTLDIDLAWHTHQLQPRIYAEDTTKYVGRFIDHSGNVEESLLATSFDVTCRAWKNRFGVSYHHCGCPLPGETLGQRLSRLVGHGSNPSYLVPPNRDDILAATHPSDHNAVFAFHHKAQSEAAQRRRREKIAKRAQRDEANGTKKRDVVHDPAFLVPVPLYYGAGVAGCAAFGGSVVNGGIGVGACAAGVGACSSGNAACGSAGGCGGAGCGMFPYPLNLISFD